VFRRIIVELKHHIPFTFIGAIGGIVIMVFFQALSSNTAYRLFYIFHPIHVLLSALVTTSMYERYKCKDLKKKCNLGMLLLVGYVGSIGIATLSDSLIPYLGEVLLGLPNRELHLGFIEEWYLVHPLALLGIGIAYFKPGTKFPHAGHVLLSTWASLFHIIMALGKDLSLFLGIGIFIFLFLSVWMPCCISDIVVPLLFVRKGVSHDKKNINY